ncbi:MULTISPECIES: hypothetical protein [Pontibacillus]|uniref:Lipoprotein n=1 Tax=Pontibacillus marinus BH030004 = DSM 16465 TaxID=1385511 RepID=A0A0A5FX83_9BACI|nr:MULTISPECIES: hypothetical protein [Pontibacillus]KGX83360.1 hypothetical protein N783_04340 [Pontibacillus marinus BH030004 = DSM 16465]QHE50878.1 hypothetical protein GS400_01950 [Pontibacillus sp. HMF3514]
MNIKKSLKIYIILLLVLAGCSDSNHNEYKIVVENLKGVGDYGNSKVITNEEQVQEVIKILDDTLWNDIKVSGSGPTYTLHVQSLKKENVRKFNEYSIYIIKDTNIIEMVRGQNEGYIKKSGEDAKTLKRILNKKPFEKES